MLTFREDLRLHLMFSAQQMEVFSSFIDVSAHAARHGVIKYMATEVF
jgi:hypothetical protein